MQSYAHDDHVLMFKYMLVIFSPCYDRPTMHEVMLFFIREGAESCYDVTRAVCGETRNQLRFIMVH